MLPLQRRRFGSDAVGVGNGVDGQMWYAGSEASSNRTDAFVMTHFLEPVF